MITEYYGRRSDYEYAVLSQHILTGQRAPGDLCKIKKARWQVCAIGPAKNFAVYYSSKYNHVIVAYAGEAEHVTSLESIHRGLMIAVAMARKYNSQLSFTGFSSGGYLAALSVFYYYRFLDGYHTTLGQKMGKDLVHAVTFESPGVWSTMMQLQSPTLFIDLKRLAITSYVSQPTPMNIQNTQVGLLYSYSIEGMEWKEPALENLQEMLSIEQWVSLFTLRSKGVSPSFTRFYLCDRPVMRCDVLPNTNKPLEACIVEPELSNWTTLPLHHVPYLVEKWYLDQSVDYNSIEFNLSGNFGKLIVQLKQTKIQRTPYLQIVSENATIDLIWHLLCKLPQMNDELKLLSKAAAQRADCILNQPQDFYEPEPWGSYLPKAYPNFTGRKKELEQIKNAFAANYPQIQEIVGLGGIGKTALAAEYVYQLTHAESAKPDATLASDRRYALIIWLSLSRQKLILGQLYSLATWLDIQYAPNTPITQISTYIYERLYALTSQPRLHKPRVLWILDDYQPRTLLQLNEGAVSIESLMPLHGISRLYFDVLVTSRYFDTIGRVRDPHFCYVLRDWQFSEALEYFNKAINPELLKEKKIHRGHLVSLLSKVGYLPLALAQFVDHANQNKNAQTSLSSSLCAEKWYYHTVQTTWLATLPQLLSRSSRAVEILLASAYLSANAIPIDLCHAYWGALNDDEMQERIKMELYFLSRSSLIEYRSHEQSIYMHKSLQHVLTLWMQGTLLAQSQNTLLLFNFIKKINTACQQRSFKKEAILFNVVYGLTVYYKHIFNDKMLTNRLLPHLDSVIQFLRNNKKERLLVSRVQGMRAECSLFNRPQKSQILPSFWVQPQQKAMQQRAFVNDDKEMAIELHEKMQPITRRYV